MSLALSICLLFISLMQLVNSAQFLNTNSLSFIFGFTVSSNTSAINIVLLTSIYPSL